MELKNFPIQCNGVTLHSTTRLHTLDKSPPDHSQINCKNFLSCLYTALICSPIFRCIDVLPEASQNLQCCPSLDSDEYHFCSANNWYLSQSHEFTFIGMKRGTIKESLVP